MSLVCCLSTPEHEVCGVIIVVKSWQTLELHFGILVLLIFSPNLETLMPSSLNPLQDKACHCNLRRNSFGSRLGL